MGKKNELSSVKFLVCVKGLIFHCHGNLRNDAALKLTNGVKDGARNSSRERNNGVEFPLLHSFLLDELKKTGRNPKILTF